MVICFNNEISIYSYDYIVFTNSQSIKIYNDKSYKLTHVRQNDQIEDINESGHSVRVALSEGFELEKTNKMLQNLRRIAFCESRKVKSYIRI